MNMLLLDAVGPAGLNVNSIVVTIGTAIILAAIGWVGRKSSDNNERLVAIGVSMPHMEKSIAALENRLGGMVTRPELDSNIAQLRVELAKIEIDIIKLKQKNGINGV